MFLGLEKLLLEVIFIRQLLKAPIIVGCLGITGFSL